MKKIKSALISVFDKENLDDIVLTLKDLNVKIYSTGGTREFIENLGVEVIAVENITGYPSILGGRVKTLHPKIFGGILGRRDLEDDISQLAEYDIPEIDLVIVDLYPFEKTVLSGASEADIIEKIDIGGISLIRAAAKNFKDVVIVPSKKQYPVLSNLLKENQGSTTIEERKELAKAAFAVSSHYDSAIHNHFAADNLTSLKLSIDQSKTLRYGENPHQKGIFFGDLDAIFDQLHGKELSYNNLLDIDAAVNLMRDFEDEEPTFAILKHNNACGLASRLTLAEAYKDALAGDPVSAFGGILIANRNIEKDTAELINELFCEVVIAPGFSNEALDLLKSKKNRVLLKQKQTDLPNYNVRSALNGVLYQEKDLITDKKEDFELVTKKSVTANEATDLEFANKLVKHTKSNTIILAKNKQLLAGGTGQTSRVDALQQAIHKAKSFGFGLSGAVMASDAFFPFPDCVEIADKEGIKAIIQPGGSIKDNLSIDYCNENGLSMVFTGNRHFKH